MLKACTLIRANLHIDPTTGSDEDFAANYAAALWLEEWRAKKTAIALSEAIAAIWEGKKE